MYSVLFLLDVMIESSTFLFFLNLFILLYLQAQTKRLMLLMCLVNVTWRCGWETLLNTITAQTETKCSMSSAWSSLRQGTQAYSTDWEVRLCCYGCNILKTKDEMDLFQAVKLGGDSKDCEETVMGGKPLAWRVCVWAPQRAEILPNGSER